MKIKVYGEQAKQIKEGQIFKAKLDDVEGRIIVVLENEHEETCSEKLEKIRKEIIDELGEDGDVDEYPPEDCYTLIRSIASILGFYDE